MLTARQHLPCDEPSASAYGARAMHEEKLIEALQKFTHEIRALTHAVVGTRPPTCSITKQDLDEMEKRIIMKQSEAAAALQAVQVELRKATDELNTKIQTLTDALANADNVSPDLEAAITAVTSQAKIVDDIVPDAVDAPVPPVGGTTATPAT